jgi:hypothetical protein
MKKIGLLHYNVLKAQKVLTPEEEEKLRNYESFPELTEEQKNMRKEYGLKLWLTSNEHKVKLDPDTTIQALQDIFFTLKGYQFKPDPESVTGLKTLVYYFLEDERFFKSPLIRDISVPSFSKGLLVIGGYGNGKSSMFEICHHFFRQYKDYAFKTFNANQVIEMYETASGYHEKEDFWSQVLKGRCHFDDVKTEREASNYGKANLFKDILERRYDARVKTHISCNYPENHPNDLNRGIQEFGEKYGGRVHDRIFEMFNVIEFKSKSYRK